MQNDLKLIHAHVICHNCTCFVIEKGYSHLLDYFVSLSFVHTFSFLSSSLVRQLSTGNCLDKCDSQHGHKQSYCAIGLLVLQILEYSTVGVKVEEENENNLLKIEAHVYAHHMFVPFHAFIFQSILRKDSLFNIVL